MAAASNDIGFTIANPDIQGTAVVYVGTAATLVLTLTNNTGAAIPLSTGASASSLTLYPARFYSSEQVTAMSVTAPDWPQSPSGRSWVLTYAGSANQWAAGAAIVITIKNALSTSQPASGFMQVNPKDMGSSVPVSVNANLSLNNPPEPGNADLTKTLAVSLNNQGSVYVSQAGDPLPNTLFLNLKNIGDKDIYTGPDSGVGTPQVQVSFVYGSTPGALATNDDPNVHAIGSAWKIEAGISVGSGWRAINPTYSQEQPDPVWVLKPTDTNFKILGTGDEANITFSFADIVSLTPPGHTQMVVQCTGFKQTDKRPYNDCTFVVDISKQVAPPTRGLLNFFGDKPLFTIYDPATISQVNLQWAMFDVPSVLLMSNLPQFMPRRIDYPKFAPLAYDSLKFDIPGMSESSLVFFTLQSFDGVGNFLNSLQFATFIQANMFVDPRDGQVYSAILAGKTLWMARNLNYNSANSVYYNNTPSRQYGRLYNWEDAADVPTGWRLPDDSDWTALFAAYGSATAAYQALIDGGSSGFSAQLGGFCDDLGNFSDLTSYGYYWSASPSLIKKTAGGSHNYAQFSQPYGTVSTGASYPDNFFASVRYVRDIQ